MENYEKVRLAYYVACIEDQNIDDHSLQDRQTFEAAQYLSGWVPQFCSSAVLCCIFPLNTETCRQVKGH